MRLAFVFPGSLASSRAHCTIQLLIIFGVSCCINSGLLEDSDSGSLKPSGKLEESNCGITQQCPRARQSQDQDDTTILLQSNKIKWERISEEEEFDRQEKQSRMQGSTSHSKESVAKLLFSTTSRFKESSLSFLSALSVRRKAAYETLQRVSVEIWVISALFVSTSFVFCLIAHNSFASRRGGQAQASASPPVVADPRAAPRREVTVESRSPLVSQTPSLAYQQDDDSPMPSLMSVPSKPQDPEPAFSARRFLPPPLCPTFVVQMTCEARFGVRVLELARLTTEGELGIVGFSGNPLFRAAVRKSGGHRKLEILTVDHGTSARATVGPNFVESSKADTAVMEIRGQHGAFYGLLEMQDGGAWQVTKDGQKVMTIDGDIPRLQLSILSAAGIPLASVRFATFGGVDYLEVRVESGVDPVLVLACVLSVLLFSPQL